MFSFFFHYCIVLVTGAVFKCTNVLWTHCALQKLFVPFHGTFSRHGKAQASLALLIWLNENVLFHSTFSRHGKAQASLALLIWLNENVLKRIANMWLAVVIY